MKKNDPQPNDRRSFLTKVINSAALLSLSAFISPLKAVNETIINPNTIGADDSKTWLKDLSGKHKMMFDVLKMNNGLFVSSVGNYLNCYNEEGLSDKDVNAVVVLRHTMVIFGVNDDMWEKYKIGQVFEVEDPKSKKPTPSTRNIYWKGGVLENFTISRLQDRGVMFGLCGKAMDNLVDRIAEVLKVSKDEVRKDIYANIIPDMQIVPSGVWAVDRAQEQGFNYCYTG